MTVHEFFTRCKTSGNIVFEYDTIDVFGKEETMYYSTNNNPYALTRMVNKLRNYNIKSISGTAKGLEIELDITTSYNIK